jgi:hypothetical protein
MTQAVKALLQSQPVDKQRMGLIESTTLEGFTAQDYAASHGHLQCVTLLTQSALPHAIGL